MADNKTAEIIEEVTEDQISESTKERRYLKPSEMISFCIVALGQKNIDEFHGAYKSKFAIDNMGISSKAFANISLATSIYDALDDTISGLIIDRTRTRWGKIKPYLLLPIPLWFIGLLMLFTVPGFDGAAKIAYYSAAVVLYGLGMSYFGSWTLIMYNNTPNIKERNTLITVSEFVRLFGTWAVSLLALPLDFLPKVGIPDTTVYQVFALFCAVLCSLACIYGFTHMRERFPLASREEMNETGVIESFKQLIKNPQMFIYVLGNFFGGFKSVGSANEKFFWANCTGKMSYATLVGLFTGIPNYFMTPLSGKWVNKIGAKKVIIAASFFGAVAYTGMYLVGFHPFSPGFNDKVVLNLVWIIVALTICGLPNCVIRVCMPSLLGDVFDYSEWKNGTRNEALVNTISGYFMKLSGSLNGWLSGMVLTWIAYEPIKDEAGELIQNTDPGVQRGLWMIFALAPAVARLLTAVAFLFFKVDGKFKTEMLAELKERREEAIEEMEKEEEERLEHKE